MLTALDQEHGFTIVELLVVIVLLAIVLSVSGRAMVDTWHVGKRNSNSSVASADISRALGRMGRDIRAAQSPDRASSTYNNDKLREVLLLDNPVEPRMRDILLATSNHLQIRGNVVQDPAGSLANYECVDYRISGGALVRTAYDNWITCGGTVLEQETLMQPLPDGEKPYSLTPVFSYTYVHNTKPNKAVIDPDADCDTQAGQSGPGTGSDTNWIHSVHVDLRSFVGPDAESAGNISLVDQFDIVTRNSHSYMYAMGCAY